MSEYYDGIGQVSFNSDCGTQCPFSSEFKTISAFGSTNENTSGESSSYNFKDLCLKLSDTINENGEMQQQSFKVNSDYYFDFYIEPIENFQTTIDLQLVNLNDTADTEYQFIRSFRLPVGVNSKSEDNLYRVIFFQRETEDKLSFVKENSLTLDDNNKIGPKKNVPLEDDQVYELVSSNSVLGGYYYCTSLNGEYQLEKIRTNFSTALVRKTWQNEIAISDEEIENNKNLIRVRGIFSPLRSGFNAIRLKIVRATEDFFLSSLEGNDIYYGRTLRISEEKSSICELINLIGAEEYISETEKIDKIGVWANPGLMFSLNGEELQVGPTGYYELDILPITRIGVAAFLDSINDESGESLPLSDDFTIDYQYKNKKATES